MLGGEWRAVRLWSDQLSSLDCCGKCVNQVGRAEAQGTPLQFQSRQNPQVNVLRVPLTMDGPALPRWAFENSDNHNELPRLAFCDWNRETVACF